MANITIGIVAGEASGDALAATLIRAVRATHPHIRFVGVAGPQMEAAGCEAWYSVEELAVRGFLEVIRHLPRLFFLRRQLRLRFLAERVPLFIGVDAPDFNFGLEKKLKRRGVRTVHFVSPSVWAWRGERVKKIGRAVNRMLALFPMEPALYEAEGVPVTYVGHPMATEAATHATRRETRELLKLKAATPVFALLPGSRLSEIEMHVELVLATAARIHEARPDARFLVPFVTRATRDAFESAMHRAGHDALPITLLYGHAEDALRAADVGIVASGTATLEAALAPRRRQQLRIAQSGDGPRRIEDDRRRKHRAGERTASCFVDAGDQHAAPARLNSSSTAAAASPPVSADSCEAKPANSASSRRRVTVSSKRLSAACATLSAVASSCRNSGTTKAPASTLGSPT